MKKIEVSVEAILKKLLHLKYSLQIMEYVKAI